MKKKYSVLMSIYDKENPDFLKLSIESMLNQTLKPDEVVIVKDGPLTEKLDKVLNKYVEKHLKLFKIVSLKENVGLGLALNEGLKVCTNQFVARMDGDDISLSDRCQKQIKEFIDDKRLSICGTMIDEFETNLNNIISSRVVPITHKEIVKFSKRRSPFNHPTVMYKKADVLKFDGYSDLPRSQDFDLFVRMLNGGCIGKNINESLLLYRSNQNNLKRRRKWSHVKNNIKMMHSFWKKGYSKLGDFLIVSLVQLILFIFPLFVFKLFSKKVLRKSKK